MDFRRARGKDFEGMVKLQDLNLAGNLNDEQKRDGFLSGAFTAEQFAAMNADLCIVVGADGEEIKAFVCSGTPEYNMDFALPRALVESFPHVRYQGKPLSEWKTCVAGPVCIDSSLRGQGVFEVLYKNFYELLPGEYELAVIFVSPENPRSIKAHEKVGMTILGSFNFKEREFTIMAGEVKKN